MKNIKKLSTFFLSIIILIILIIFDFKDRGNSNEMNRTDKFYEEFLENKSFEEIKVKFQSNFKNPSFTFPRTEVSNIKIFKNSFLISRLTSKKINEKDINDLVAFFNNSENFTWSETTWELEESEYFLRFYDKNNEEIGKVWLCIEDCGMTFSKPFSPNMKFGGISKIGKVKLNQLLKSYI